VESKGVKVNINKTKVIISGESCKKVQNPARWPCGVCGRDVGRNKYLPTPLPWLVQLVVY